MTQFVLVPGAWLGAWAWKDVVSALENDGHRAIPVTLTGMGERVHLGSESHGMATAVDDVLNEMRYREAEECVLVGHSFAGKVAAAVTDRSPRSIRRVVYVDAFRPERTREPQGGFDPRREFGPPPTGAHGIPLTEAILDRIGPDVTGAHRARMMALATPWPIRLGLDPITLSERFESVPESYVFCTKSGDPVDEIVAGKWGKLEGPHRILETGHWPMITDPRGLARALVALGSG
jgi:pimeloyl-ACP methyl ester carboxylesterase